MVHRDIYFILFLFLKDYLDKLTNIEEVRKFQIKIKAGYIIYGRVRERDVGGGKEDYFLDLNGYVSHAPADETVGKALGNEFGQLLPRKVRIAKENDIYKFQFTSEWALYVSKYIIAIALALSGILDKALDLFNELYLELAELIPPNKELINVKNRAPKHILEVYLGYCRHYYELWREKKVDDKYIAKQEEHINAIPNEVRKTEEYYTIKAIMHFIKDKDIKNSEINLTKIRDRGYLWHFNYAFIKAYVGELSIAIYHYRQALKMSYEAKKIIEIEEFMFWVVETESDKYQLYFCLGFYNWKIKRDLGQALNDFRYFLKNGEETEFKKQRKLAKNWIKNVERELTKKS